MANSKQPEMPSRIFFHMNSEVPYGFMCQFYPASFTDSAVHPAHTFNCAEQYMMFCKALIMAGSTDGTQATLPENIAADKKALMRRLLTERDPARQKYLVRAYAFTPQQEKLYQQIKYDIVVKGNMAKFSQNEELKEKLLMTGEAELIEAAPNDRTWGIGFSSEDAEANEFSWGSNLLGLALMDVRAALR